MLPPALNSEPLEEQRQASWPLGKHRLGIDFPTLEEESACLCCLPCVWAGNGSLRFASTPDGSLGLLPCFVSHFSP